ncbi:CidA/LrgA family protein [Treponema sp.]|uniref:CidA/LrgA family protein n=1 Tax=Treponema sp. TaxID=166 RepID=UPI00298E041B|nr:CidA/LrgA family protein [Treponema sp.]MCQ2241954.1 CidA/LrgA family protein [Treponema sp.]
MNYVKQFCIILAFSFTGEVLNRIIPLPVPASIYGLVLLFLALEFKIIKVEHIKEVSKFLLGIMTLFFVPSSVGFINALPLMKKYGLLFISITIVSTLIVFAVTGQVTQALMKIRNRNSVSEKPEDEE